MADFCKQCSIEHFGKDYGDLKRTGARRLTEGERRAGMAWRVLCEGCGPTFVNDEGECVALFCEKHRGKKK